MRFPGPEIPSILTGIADLFNGPGGDARFPAGGSLLYNGLAGADCCTADREGRDGLEDPGDGGRAPGQEVLHLSEGAGGAERSPLRLPGAAGRAGQPGILPAAAGGWGSLRPAGGAEGGGGPGRPGALGVRGAAGGGPARQPRFPLRQRRHPVEDLQGVRRRPGAAAGGAAGLPARPLRPGGQPLRRPLRRQALRGQRHRLDGRRRRRTAGSRPAADAPGNVPGNGEEAGPAERGACASASPTAAWRGSPWTPRTATSR